MKEKISILCLLAMVWCTNSVFALEEDQYKNYKVMKAKPNYEYIGNESIDEMRKRTVQVMRDTLTFVWSPKKSFSYVKSEKTGEYNFEAGKLYANLPYTNGCSGLFQWLYYYDYQTGIFDYPDWNNVGKNLGNSCTASVVWATSATCSSISKRKSRWTTTLTPDYLSIYMK